MDEDNEWLEDSLNEDKAEREQADDDYEDHKLETFKQLSNEE